MKMVSLVNNLKDGWIRCHPEEGPASNGLSLFGVALLGFCFFSFPFSLHTELKWSF